MRSISEETVVPETSSDQKLKGSWQLLKESWSEYQARFFSVVGIMAVPLVFSFTLKGWSTLSIALPNFSQASWFSIVSVVLWFMLIFFQTLSNFAILFAIKNGTGMKESLVQSWRIIFSSLFVVLLCLTVVTGGYILLLVPGILFSAWFSLAFYSFVFEGKRGMAALYRSKQLVSGNFWKVVWRWTLLSVFVVVIFSPILILAKYFGGFSGIFEEILLQLFFVPFTIIFGVALFRDLARMKQENPSWQPRIFEKFFYSFSALIATPLVFGFFFLVGLWLSSHDIPEPDDSDLRLQAVNIPQEENGYFVFSEVKHEDIFWPSEKGLDAMLSGETWDEPVVQEVLQKNERALQIFERGIVFPVYQEPQLQNPDVINATTVIGDVRHLRRLAQVNTLLALSLSRQGREKEAIEQTLKTIKMGEMLFNGQNSTLHYLIGIASRRIGFEALRVIVENSNRIFSSDLVQYARDIALHESGSKPLQNVFRGEYTMEVNSLFNGDLMPSSSAMAQQTFPGLRYYFPPNKTKLLLMEIAQRNIENAGQMLYKQIYFLETKKPSYFYLKSLFSENAIGKILAFSLTNAFDSIFAKKFQDDFLVRVSQTLLALKAFEQDRETLPNSLQGLVPAYLSEVPQDPFDGKEIRYIPERRILYSTGEDLIDDGGDIDEENWQGGKDIGFSVK